MSGAGLFEILIVIIISLCVLGPEQTFRAAFALGKWWKRLTSYLNRCQKELGLNGLAGSGVLPAVPAPRSVPDSAPRWVFNGAGRPLSQKALLKRIESLERELNILKKPVKKKASAPKAARHARVRRTA